MCDDRLLGTKVGQWQGAKIVCGGTTAKIVARELHRTITVNINRRGETLPPTSNIYGVDIVSEGIITLGRVRNLLHQIATDAKPMFLELEKSVDARIVQQMLAHRSITMVIGTRLNRANFDPALPVNLERRVELLGDIGKVLREEFRKKVTIEYL